APKSKGWSWEKTPEDPGSTDRPLPSWNAAVASALPTWVLNWFTAAWVGVTLVPLGKRIELVTLGKVWASSPKVLSTWLSNWLPMNCSSGIRCPVLLTDRRVTGVVLKKVLIRETACWFVVLSSRVRALADAPVVPLSWPDWTRVLRRLVRLRGPEPRRAFWIAGTRRMPACGRRAAWVESR